MLWTAAGSLFYLSCWVPVAMYLMHSVASSAVWPCAVSQSISLAASVAVILYSSIVFTSCPVDLSGFPLTIMSISGFIFAVNSFFGILSGFFFVGLRVRQVLHFRTQKGVLGTLEGGI